MRLLPIAVMLAISAVPIDQTAAQVDERPKDLGLVERAQRHLGQIDVTIDGPRAQISSLAISDFSLTIEGKRITPTAVDALCLQPRPSGPSPDPTQIRTSETPSPPPTSYLFYFDQRNMTFSGRRRAVETAKDLIRRVAGGSRGAIVSSGRQTMTYAGFTVERQALVAALDQLLADVGQWDNYAELERSRQDELQRMQRLSRESACQQAKNFQREELMREEQALELFQTTLGRFADMDPPKVAIYFADTLRHQPGRHYPLSLGRGCDPLSINSDLFFEGVHRAAATYGVRVYAVQAEGLVGPDVSNVRAARNTALRDAQSGLKNLTLETGGDAFLNGASAESIVGRIENANGCGYVLSFDPAPFPEDRPLAVHVEVTIPGIRVRTPTHIVLQSESGRRMAKLLAAFTAPETLRDAIPIHGGLVPLDIQDGRLRVLVQATFPGTRIAGGEEWDIGMSVISGPEVSHAASGRISVDRPQARIVLETETELTTGPYDIALVAMQGNTGQVATGRVSGIWTGSFAGGVALPAILQPTDGAFLRDGKVRTNGSIVVNVGEALLPDRPAAFVTVVCRTGKRQASARVHRALTGPTTTSFPPLELSFKEGACAQVRDVVPAGDLRPGAYSYEIGVEASERRASRQFSVKERSAVVSEGM